MSDKKCENCRYFHPSPEDGWGECRAALPVGAYHQGELFAEWPQVDINKWCGQHAEPKEGAGR